MCAEAVARMCEVGTRHPLHVRARSVGEEVPVGAGVQSLQDLFTGACVR